jgi:hypothetical protein
LSAIIHRSCRPALSAEAGAAGVEAARYAEDGAGEAARAKAVRRVAVPVVIFACSLCLLVFGFTEAARAIQFQAGDWTTECAIEKPSGDCSIIGLLKGNSTSGTKGSFALAIELQTGQVALVGKPDPVGGVIRVDKSAPVECRGSPCVFPSGQAEALIGQLSTGRLVLVDLLSQKETFRLSITTAGYRSGIAKIQAHRGLLR